MSVITSGGAGGLLALARHHTPGVESPRLSRPSVISMILPVAQRGWFRPPESSAPRSQAHRVPNALGWESAVELVEAAGLYGKIAAGWAGPRQLVEQLSILIEADLPFKITIHCRATGWPCSRRSRAGRGASIDDAAELMRLNDRDRISIAVSRWDQTTQSRIRAGCAVRHRSRTGRDQQLTMNSERPAP